VIHALKSFFVLPPVSPETGGAQRRLAIIGWALFVFTALWAILFVPMCMDEALPYHPLACLAYPFAKFHVFREGCDGRYDLVLFGLHIPSAYHYAGFLSSLLYAPVYFVFHTPGAQLWFGLIFFVLFACLFARLLPPTALSLPIILSFFPLLFQFIHDTGPVRFSLLAYPLGAMWFRQMTAAKEGQRWAFALGLALLVFLGTEDKIFFVYLLPGYSFFCLAFLDEKSWAGFWARLKRHYVSILFTVFLSGVGIAVLFCGTMHEEGYFKYLREMAQETYGVERTLKTLLLYLLAWPVYAHRVFQMTKPDTLSSLTINIIVASVFFMLGGIFAFLKKSPGCPAPRTTMLMLSFVVTLIIFLAFSNVWAGHHFIFLWIPLLALLIDFFAARAASGGLMTMAFFYAASALSVLVLMSWPFDVQSAPERENIFAYFQDAPRADAAIINYSSWGGYYLSALYGPKNQLVTYTEPMTNGDAQKLYLLSRRTNRRIYDVCYDPFYGTPNQGTPENVDGKVYDSICSRAYLEDKFGGQLDFEDMLPNQKIWHVFAATPHS
jgi:hypothetical protein